jgi:hypothetical protein
MSKSGMSIDSAATNAEIGAVVGNWVWAGTSRGHRTSLGQATFVSGRSNGVDGEIKRPILPNRWAISRPRRSRSHERSLAAGTPLRESWREVNRATERDDAENDEKANLS